MTHLRALSGWTGTSLANLGLATMLAAIFTGIPGIGCHLGDTNDPVVVIAKAPPQIFQMNGAPQPAIVPRREGARQTCGDRTALDRFPRITSPFPANDSVQPASACLLVNATGRVDRVAHATLSARRRIEPMMSEMRFQPALRDGRPVPAWVELRL